MTEQSSWLHARVKHSWECKITSWKTSHTGIYKYIYLIVSKKQIWFVGWNIISVWWNLMKWKVWVLLSEESADCRPNWCHSRTSDRDVSLPCLQTGHRMLPTQKTVHLTLGRFKDETMHVMLLRQGLRMTALKVPLGLRAGFHQLGAVSTWKKQPIRWGWYPTSPRNALAPEEHRIMLRDVLPTTKSSDSHTSMKIKNLEEEICVTGSTSWWS